MKHWYIYVMANKPNGVIYIGVTDNIEEMNPSWSDLSENWNIDMRRFRSNK